MEIRILGPGDRGVLDRVADGVFDGPVRDDAASSFLDDPRHHLVVAIVDDRVVGFVSGVHYVHPDKDPELWINEVGVAPTHRRLGLARRLVQALFAHARTLGCREAWVLTEEENEPAIGLYHSLDGRRSGPPPVMFSFELRGEPPG